MQVVDCKMNASFGNEDRLALGGSLCCFFGSHERILGNRALAHGYADNVAGAVRRNGIYDG